MSERNDELSVTAKSESLEEFYFNRFRKMPGGLRENFGHFNVFRLEDWYSAGKVRKTYSRREFYKITLLRGRSRYHYANKSFEVNGSTLLFFSPDIPYTFEPLSDRSGYFCIFKDEFFNGRMRGTLQDLPMFSPGGQPCFQLPETHERTVTEIFEKIIKEMDSDYVYKYELIQSYVTELIYNALKAQPEVKLYHHPDASARIAGVFAELLERQFPIESVTQRLTLRSACDFADKLSVHVNHLNRSVKLATGRTTSEHIAERVIAEAKALLKFTDWSAAEIGYCLGFVEAAYFNNFFKKHTGVTPLNFRNV